MVICLNCSAENVDGNKFCSRCGTKLMDPSDMDYKAEVLKAESRKLLHEKYKQQQSNSRQPIKPEIKSYPALSSAASWNIFFGWILIIIGAIILTASCVLLFGAGSGAGLSFNTDSGLAKTLGAFASSLFLALGLGLMMSSFAYFMAGFALIAHGETIHLFIDLQGNADRQTAALNNIYHLLENEQEERTKG